MPRDAVGRASISDVQLLSTGVAELDRILGGGIPARQILLVAGHPGSGKTILAGQIAFASAARGDPVVLATAASEPHSKLIESLHGFGFFRRELWAVKVRAGNSPREPWRFNILSRTGISPEAVAR
jgi:RecA/RadA recombinase